MDTIPYRDRQGAALSADEYPEAYLITFRTYGTWLHGDDRGSIDREHNCPGEALLQPNRGLLGYRTQQLRHGAVTLDARCRAAVEQTIREVCRHRNWPLQALNVRSNHVHVVVAAATKPERIMNSFKSWATRRLREAQLIGPNTKLWSRHGSTRYLWNQNALEAACLYTEDGQGENLALHEPLPDGRGTDFLSRG